MIFFPKQNVVRDGQMVRRRACNENNCNSKIIIFLIRLLYYIVYYIIENVLFDIKLFYFKVNQIYIYKYTRVFFFFFKRSVNLVLTLILMEIALPRLIKSNVLIKHTGAYCVAYKLHNIVLIYSRVGTYYFAIVLKK